MGKFISLKWVNIHESLFLFIPEESVTTKLSFCDQKAVPNRMCENTEIAVTLRGIGPIIYDIVGDISCRCSEPLVLQKSVPDGPFSMRYYACGKVSDM